MGSSSATCCSRAQVTKVSGVPLSGVSLEVAGGVMTMRFTRPLATPAVALSSAAVPSVLLCAWGASAQLSGHSDRAAFQLDLSGAAASGAGGALPLTRLAQMKLVHGSLMLTGWGFTLPLGVVIASQLKGVKDPLWFQLHRALQLVGLALALGAFVIALIEFAPFGGGVHGSLGVTAMALGLAQPLNAFLRPHPQPRTPWRRVWEALHKGSGYAALMLACAAIITGLVLLDTQEKGSLPNAVAGLVATYAAVAVAVFVVAPISFRVLRHRAAAPNGAKHDGDMQQMVASSGNLRGNL